MQIQRTSHLFWTGKVGVVLDPVPWNVWSGGVAVLGSVDGALNWAGQRSKAAIIPKATIKARRCTFLPYQRREIPATVNR